MIKKIKSFDGICISYDIAKSKKKSKRKNRYIILLHGIGGNLKSFEKTKKFLLEKNYSVVSIDLRGHGKSDRPLLYDQYNIDNFSNDIKFIIDYEKITDYVLVGHSFSGMILEKFHELYPNLSKGYVLISSSYKTPLILRLILNNIIVNFFLNPLFEFCNKIKSIFFGKKIKYFYPNYKKYIETNDFNFPRIFSDIKYTGFISWVFTYETLSRFNGYNILKSIKQDVLFIHGLKDSVFNYKISKKMHDVVKNSKLSLIPNANHIIVINDVEELNLELDSFLEFLKNF
jgi:2-succinyl-6-hydroxy-2,4-cyclohexadiene-1-carboxylate synthase